MENQCTLCLKANEKTFKEAREGKIAVMCQKYIGKIEICNKWRPNEEKQEEKAQRIYLKVKVVCTNPKNLKKLLGLDPRKIEFKKEDKP
jgi:hypothetical protein